jgi:protein required for attachment to host cells
MSQPHWIVVANGSQARLLQRDHPGTELREIMHWVHPQTRQHMGNPDSAHRTSGMRGRSGLAPPQNASAHAREQFAREISQWLKKAVDSQGIGQLTVFASNPFLGELMSHEHGLLERHVFARHPLDLTSLTLPELDLRLHQHYGL